MSVFFHAIWGPLRSFLCILYWGPQFTFFAYYMGPLRSLSSHTMWGPLSDQFRCLLWGPSQISFYACYRGGGGTSDFSFFTKYMGAPSDQFLRLLYGAPQASFFAYYMGPLRLVFVHTFWGALFFYYMGPPQISFFAYYMRTLDQISFFAYYMHGGPLRSVYLLTI